MTGQPRPLGRWESLFTRQERMALAFLVAAGFFGLGLQAVGWRLQAPGAEAPPAAISVNRAGLEELTALPGIGPVMARRVVEDRRQHGRFLTLSDLRRVKGISPKTLEELRGRVCFD
jgi:competence protein ComEA